MRRPELVDTLGRKQALDPVHVLHALSDQPLALAVSAARVLALHGRHLDHTAGGPVAAAPGYQRPQ